MKIALILASNIWYSPYVKIYSNILDERGIDYDLISWNRDGRDSKIGYQYNVNMSYVDNSFEKIKHYLRYVSFVKKIVKRNNYDKLIVFGSQIAIPLTNFLVRNYKQRYIFDFRDLSIEQKCLFKPIFKKLLKNSFANVISSPGFIEYLPKNFNYLISHNFDYNLVLNSIGKRNEKFNDSFIKILTIGGIRHFDSNIELVEVLANKMNFELSFVGKGDAVVLIENYVRNNKINNVKFVGYYDKSEEGGYVQDCTFVNIYWKYSSALSNRFYNALIYKKPIIVKANSIQGDYVEKYNLGLVINDCVDLDLKIQNYLNTFDRNELVKNCDLLLKLFLNDYDIFCNKIKNFIE